MDRGLRVALTLRFLAMGNSCKSLDYAFPGPPNTISHAVPETCKALAAAFGDEFLQMPDSVRGWEETASGFQESWNFPHIRDAIDREQMCMRIVTWFTLQ